MTSPVSEQDLNSEVELLSSPYLIRQALSGVPEHKRSGIAAAARRIDACAVGFARKRDTAALHEVPNMTPREQWATTIEQNRRTSVIKRSNVIEVEFRSHDPQWSAISCSACC